MAFATPGPHQQNRRVDFEVIGDCINTYIAHWQAYLTAGVVMLASAAPLYVVDLLPSLPDLGEKGNAIKVGAFLTYELLWLLPSLLLTPLMCVGVTKYTLNITRGGEPDMSHIWEGFRNPLSYLWMAFLTGLVSFLGILLCCFGMYVTAGLMMFTYPLKVETNASAGECVSTSWDMLKDQWGMAAVFCFVIEAIGSLAGTYESIGFALLWPFVYIAHVHLYNRYTGHHVPKNFNPQQPVSPYPRQGQYGGSVPQQPQQPQSPKPHPGADPNRPSPGSDPLRPDRP